MRWHFDVSEDARFNILDTDARQPFLGVSFYKSSSCRVRITAIHECLERYQEKCIWKIKID